MKPHIYSGSRLVVACVTAILLPLPAAFNAGAAETGNSAASDAEPANTSEPIPWKEIGTRAGAQYGGDGLAIIPTNDGAILRCVFQRLDGEATTQGLWLSSTVTDVASDCFRVVAAAMGRGSRAGIESEEFGSLDPGLEVAIGISALEGIGQTDDCKMDKTVSNGLVEAHGNLVRFIRPNLTEEYSLSMDGVRQDFIIAQRPKGNGELRLDLAVTGARVEATSYGARLVLENSGRNVAYSRLQVMDATGRQLPARIEVLRDAATRRTSKAEVPGEAPSLTILVNDVNAVYPIRIDPTFSDENWISVGPFAGADGAVKAAVVDEAGNLYIGGAFTTAGDSMASRVAKWDGTGWSVVASTMDGDVYALAALATDLYVGGSFTTVEGIEANYIARWDGNDWSALSLGLSGPVNALAVSGTDLYAGGSFTNAGGIQVNSIAKWNGGSWQTLGSGLNGPVSALTVWATNLYAGGSFTRAGGIAATNIARWNGSSWSALRLGINGPVYALAISAGWLYAGGEFQSAGGYSATNIAAWSGSSWSPVRWGVNGRVYALAASGNDLYVGGAFTAFMENQWEACEDCWLSCSHEGEPGTEPGTDCWAYCAYVCEPIPVWSYGIAKWNSGRSWSALGLYGDANVFTLAVSGDNVYAGGVISRAGETMVNNIAEWDGSAWLALGKGGLNELVDAIAITGSDVYVGGYFTEVAALSANRIAKWDGTAWSTLGVGMNEAVFALAVSGSDVYAGGVFTTAGGISANRVAKWDGSSWSPLGSGINGSVYALEILDTALYAGSFLVEGDIATGRVEKWDGSSWSSLDSGMTNHVVRALAVMGSSLYAAFDVLGGNASHIFEWNGNDWSALGSGMDGSVMVLAVWRGELYAGGVFSTAGGVSASRIAKWDGNSWSPLGAGMVQGFVAALATSEHHLYAAGSFWEGAGGPGNRIARWDGTSWSALGSGLDSDAHALGISGGDLYVGGFFTAAGTKGSAFIAKADISMLSPPLPFSLTAPQRLLDGSFRFTVTGEPHRTYTLQFSTNLVNWTDLQSITPDSTPFEWVDKDAAGEQTRFYRATAR
jgi:trimeric autotransporter adhesin